PQEGHGQLRPAGLSPGELGRNERVVTTALDSGRINRTNEDKHMLATMTDTDKMSASQRLLVERLQADSTDQMVAGIDFQGGQRDVQIYWNKRKSYWFGTATANENRYWNVFGIERLGSKSSLAITCEINFPFSGIKRTIGGVLME